MTNNFGFLQRLEAVIEQRRSAPSDDGYTASLLRAGRQRIAQKVGEEGVELALAAVGDDTERVVAESADLLYHVLVLLAERKLNLQVVVNELERRHQP